MKDTLHSDFINFMAARLDLSEKNIHSKAYQQLERRLSNSQLELLNELCCEYELTAYVQGFLDGLKLMASLL